MTQQFPSTKIIDPTLPLNLLLVDDDDVDREKLCRVLAQTTLAHTITIACSIAEAKSHLANTKFDCVLLDYRLGNALGTDLLTDIHVLENLHTPVIMITGDNDIRLAVKVIKDGVYDFIPKNQLHPDLVQVTLQNSIKHASDQRELQIKTERMEFLSFYDLLTGLPNRALFFDRLDQALHTSQRSGKSCAVMQIDLDLFKNVNDTFGHAAGDSVLTVAAQRIKNSLRATDTVARLGGDEFAVVLADSHTVDVAMIVAKKINIAMREPIQVGSNLIQIGASVGVALYPDQANTAEVLLAKADCAMYYAKKAKGYCAYTDDMVLDKNTKH